MFLMINFMNSMVPDKKLISLSICLMGLILSSPRALAEESGFLVKPFIFVEGVDQEFYVDNVLTAHIVAAAGLALEYNPTSEDIIEVSIGNGDFDVDGIKIDTEVKKVSYLRDLSALMKWPIFIKVADMKRSIAAENSKVDKETRKSLKDELDSSFHTTDLLLGLNFSLTKHIQIKAATGASSWHMEANVNDQFMVGRFRATAFRVVNSKGTDAVHELGLEGGAGKWSLFLLLSQRSLGSKADENIQGISLGGRFKF